MSKIVQVSARVSEDLKEEAAKVLKRQGLDISTAIKMLITKTAVEQRLPLDMTSSEIQELDTLFRKEIGKRINAYFDKIPAKVVDKDHPENMAEFFDEDFPEYEDDEIKDDKK